ncbi:phosphatase PAP2 family protein [Pontibacter cellulosilyticus]|uniref:Phosphatase PAP2 family protein n=1 Tax=Pontibacter cellulosilyticus TaxID=1720253 RepID=A0A923N773_9BACT|nr:phosphatase PAP2 family protein [Pontibacter cellulosilyticus]MBC5993454.1 phosphatase PAP2 family protein [Pontibacter cellulosilyticus]
MKRIVQKFISLLALLSLEVIVLWAAFIGCLLLFLFMANTVFIEQDTALDVALFKFAETHTNEQNTRIMKAISYFASVEYLMVVPPLFVLLFSFYKDLRWYGLKILIISFSSSVLNQGMKHVFERPRPEIAMLHQSGLSFPSGHAMIGGAFYGLLIYIVWRTVANKVWRFILVILLTALILLIGYSRIYLRVHYATDVLAGYAMGILWLMASVYLMRRLEKIYVAKFELQA